MPNDSAGSELPVPGLSLRWSGGSQVTVSEEVFPASGGEGLRIGRRELTTPMRIVELPAGRAFSFGCPVVGGKIDLIAAARGFGAARDRSAFARAIGGQFLLGFLPTEGDELILANDRFNGIPLYWAQVAGNFRASLLYDDLFAELRSLPGFSFDHRPALQFIWLQKLLGETTYDAWSRFLMPATLLHLTPHSSTAERYWRPDFTKIRRTRHDAGEEFRFLLERSVARLTSDAPRRFGIFLSGGHDSRTLLASFERPTTCYTVAFADNYEVDCARRAARHAGKAHRFLALDRDHLSRHQATMARLCGGMFATDNALFVGAHREVESEVLFHGHGFDYLFQGMYLPSRWRHLLGRPTFFRRQEAVPEDVAAYFLDHLPFRIRDTDLPALMNGQREEMLDHLRAAIADVVADTYVANRPEDRWEYLFVHALGRHYSHPNIVSTMTAGEQRTVAFDPDLFAFYCSLEDRHRLHAGAMRHAMWRRSPGLARIPTGNYGMPAGAGPAYKTWFLAKRKIARHLTGDPRQAAPDAEDRTWPDRDRHVRENRAYRSLIENALASDLLPDLIPYFDWARVRKEASRWLAETDHGGKFLVALLSLHGFLSRHY